MVNSLKDGAEYFANIRLALPHATKEAMSKSAKLIRDEARRVMGTYDYDWPRLQPATVKHKATGDSPLLETGELRASLHYSAEENEAVIGSDNPKALWHELGTSRGIPPRSFLVGAAMHKEAEVLKICGEDVFAFALTTKAPQNTPSED